ncbi:5'-methylthioadenosine/S-adenosylhomocysteine nucleosidase [Paraburkholderia aspalathi]|nr:5'-methylthioadenosine/S-adenosylhomocysteine nucleosidase [Paraburkholderia aspalathi]
MSAFEPEWIELQNKLSDPKEIELNGTTFLTGKIEGKEVVLFLSGVSMVNAAMTTQMALDQFNISSIVFSGIAGGVDPSLNIGDVVVPEQWGQYLEARYAREIDGKFVIPSYVPVSLPNYGMIFPREVKVNRSGGKIEKKFWFKTDPKLLEIAAKVATEIRLEDCVTENKCLSKAPAIQVGGNGVSGTVFVDNADFREYTFNTFKATVLDMESAAVAQVADTNGVPFIAFRSLSDLAGGGEGENEMGTFMDLASANSAAVVSAFLAALP